MKTIRAGTAHPIVNRIGKCGDGAVQSSSHGPREGDEGRGEYPKQVSRLPQKGVFQDVAHIIIDKLMSPTVEVANQGGQSDDILPVPEQVEERSTRRF